MKRVDYPTLLMTGLLVLCISAVSAQRFQPTHIRDLARMSNNWGNAVADYDQDGDLDIFVVAYASFRPNAPETWSRLLENRGGNWFEDRTVQAGFGRQYASSEHSDHKIGAAWGDYDNDGFPDLFLTHEGHVQLYHNQGDGTFSEMTESASLEACTTCVNSSALWWDYDRDGWLDLYVSNYVGPNRLYHNQGDGTFTKVAGGLGLEDPGSTWYSLPIDVDRDGWQDLYVINDYGYSRFYRNEAGIYFVDMTLAFGLRNTGNGMGATIGDYNNDGHFDIYVTNIAELQANALFTGSDTGYFTDDQAMQQVGNGHWGWGTRLFDADHDGDEDLYLVNGFGDLRYPNKFFKNMQVEGQPFFTDWSAESQTADEAQGMSLEVFDYDQDGDLDMLVSNMDAAPQLYNNVGRRPGSHWLQVDLQGTISNRNAFGAVVRVQTAGKTLQRYYHGSSIMGQSIQPVHFGLGEATTVDSLTVIWPSSEAETFYNIGIDQKITLVEQAMTTSVRPKTPSPASLSIQPPYPNPVQHSAVFAVSSKQSGMLYGRIVDLYGRTVWQTETYLPQAGRYHVRWNATAPNPLPAGTYFYSFRLGHTQISGKIRVQP